MATESPSLEQRMLRMLQHYAGETGVSPESAVKILERLIGEVEGHRAKAANTTVSIFCSLMERRLQVHEGKARGFDSTGPKNLQDLYEAVDTLRRLVWTEGSREVDLMTQAADVANWAMIVGLTGKRRG